VTAILLRTCCLWNFVEGKFQFVFQFSLEFKRNLYAIYCVLVFRESSSARNMQRRRRRNTSTLVNTEDNESHMVEEEANICQGVKKITLSSLKYDFVY
jgi:cell division protein FtsB